MGRKKKKILLNIFTGFPSWYANNVPAEEELMLEIRYIQFLTSIHAQKLTKGSAVCGTSLKKMLQTANNRPSRTCMKYCQKQSIGSKTVKYSFNPSKLIKNGWKCPQSPNPSIPQSPNPPIPQSPNLTFLHSYIPTFPHSYIPTFLHSYIPTFLYS